MSAKHQSARPRGRRLGASAAIVLAVMLLTVARQPTTGAASRSTTGASAAPSAPGPSITLTGQPAWTELGGDIDLRCIGIEKQTDDNARISQTVNGAEVAFKYDADGLLVQAGQLAPAGITAAVNTASDQGWRRPLLAWLGVQLKRAEGAGDTEAQARIQRRISLMADNPLLNP